MTSRSSADLHELASHSAGESSGKVSKTSETNAKPYLSPKILDIPTIGLTALWTPEDQSKIIADVCFVHGLGGHPRKTWQYGPADGKKKSLLSRVFHRRDANRSTKTEDHVDESDRAIEGPCYWPFDLLQRDFDNIRIMTYGYDSSPSHWYKCKTTQMTIDQHTQTMLQRISNARASCKRRPIIFIAHSLGGILVKNMIILSAKYKLGNLQFQDVGQSCHAIVFFGTPHRGVGAVELGMMVANVIGALPGGPSVYKDILRSLQPDSEKLISILTDFNDIMEENIPAPDKIQIYSFQEGQGYSRITTLDHKVVPDGSSIFNRRAFEQSSHIPANHIDMCRFKTATDSGYSDFKAALTGYLVAIAEKGATKAAQNEDMSGHRQNVQDRDMLNSLDFQERTIRRQHLGEIRVKKETFKWIWGSEIKVWLASNVPLFWIVGKPASGKSTLMDHLSRNKKSEELLQSYITEEWVVVHHFFDFRGRGGMRNNFPGFLQSLLFQLLSQLPGSIAQVRTLGWNQEEKSHQWSTAELLTAFDVVLKTASRPIFFLLDGLDEYGGDKFELCSFIKSFPSTRMKVCIASRPDPPFPDAFHGLAQIRMDRLNSPGILAFVTEALKDFWRPSDFTNDTELTEIAKEITERANGVFLWARFAVFEVIDGHTKGEKHVEWEARLNKVPRELEDVYSRIVAARSPSEKWLTSRLLQFICYAQRVMTMQELFVAMSLTTPSAQRLLQSKTALVDPQELHIFRKRILASSGGVIETLEISHESNAREIVQIIHRTVEFYLDKRGWSDLHVKGEDLARPHYLWLQACTKLLQNVDLASALNDPEVRKRPPFESYANVSESPLESSFVPQSLAWELQRPRSNGSKFTSKALLQYVLLFLPEHAKRLESGTMISSHELLHKVLSQHYVDAHILAWEDNTCRCCSSLRYVMQRQNLPASPPTLAIVHGMALFIRDSLYTRGPGFVVPPQPQEGALVNSLARMARLAVGGYLFKDDPKPLSVTFLAIQGASLFPTLSRRTILETLLAVEPTVGDMAFRTALRTAPLEVIKILLDKGSTSSGQLIFLSSVDYHNWDTSRDQKLKIEFRFLPLWEVAKREDAEDTESVIDLFLQRGEDINAQCGPFGTALHSFLKNMNESYGVYQSEVLRTLVCKGADVNAEGPKGKPLEYMWMLANTSSHGKIKYARKYSKPLRDLIKLGAVNMKEDPNGMVPSMERMTSWPTNRYSDYQEYKRFYLDGPLPQG